VCECVSGAGVAQEIQPYICISVGFGVVSCRALCVQEVGLV
jgi:hypothetical protein